MTLCYRALCQDCLRVFSFQTQPLMYDACSVIGFCSCGGDVCCCSGCLSAVSHLESGNLKSVPGIQSGYAIRSWSPEKGAVVFSLP